MSRASTLQEKFRIQLTGSARVRHLTLHSLNSSSQKGCRASRRNAKAWACTGLQLLICCILGASPLMVVLPCFVKDYRKPLGPRPDSSPLKGIFQQKVAFAPMAPDDIGRNTLAAAMAGWVQPAIFNPADCLRIRWQVSVGETTFAKFSAELLRKEGLWQGLWRPGLPFNMCAVAVSQGLRMGLYPTARDALQTLLPSDGQKSSAAMIGAGLMSGSFAYFTGAPLWLVKTRMQAAVQFAADGASTAVHIYPVHLCLATMAQKLPGGSSSSASDAGSCRVQGWATKMVLSFMSLLQHRRLAAVLRALGIWCGARACKKVCVCARARNRLLYWKC
eukprot:s4192_g1.t4